MSAMQHDLAPHGCAQDPSELLQRTFQETARCDNYSAISRQVVVPVIPKDQRSTIARGAHGSRDRQPPLDRAAYSSLPIARSTDTLSPPLKQIARQSKPSRSSSSKPPLNAKKPMEYLTASTITANSMTSAAAASRVKSPMAKQIPPKNSTTPR